MFSQQEVWRGMERDCYCCRPGPSVTSPAPVSFTMEPYSLGRPCPQPHTSCQPETSVMDVESALHELDSLNSATSHAQPSASSSNAAAKDQRPERKARVRSLSESMASTSCKPAKSHSETSLYRPLELEARGSHHHRTCVMGSKMIGCSLSLPRKFGNYHMVQRNSAFVSDISATRLPLQHPPQLPAHWAMPDSGVGSYSEQSSSKSSSPSSMGSYRESDILEERQAQKRLRQRKVSLLRKDRYRRMRQPYSIPFRMCQSMSEESTASLNDFLSGAGSSRTSVSTTASPLKPQVQITKSRSIDNLELAKLRLTDNSDTRQTDGSLPLGQDVEQMATEMKNLHMV